MDIGILVNQIIWGVLIGVSYSLLAISFSLIFVAAGTINFANGEFAMLGAYFCYTVVSKLHGNILLGILIFSHQPLSRAYSNKFAPVRY